MNRESSAQPREYGARLRIMPLGDSITYGWTGDFEECPAKPGDPGREPGYRHRLGRLLEAGGCLFDFVGSMCHGPASMVSRRHEGHCGYTTADLLAHLAGWITMAAPTVVLLHAGTNDMHREEGWVHAAERLGQMLDVIHTKAPSARTLVATIIPSSNPTLAARGATYNAAIPALVAEAVRGGMAASVVTMHEAVSVRDLNDSIHPTRIGYDKMADSWFEALRACDAGDVLRRPSNPGIRPRADRPRSEG